MKARRMQAFLLALAVAGLAGCQKLMPDKTAQTKEQNAYQKIQTTLLSTTTYQSEATVEYKSNKGSNTYDTLQQCKISGEYRVEVVAPENVAGNVTLSDGKTICQFNPKITGRIAIGTKESQERTEILLTTFIKNYLKSQEVSISVANLGQGQCTVLEAVIPGDHPYLSSEKLWVDNQTLKPVKLVVYDPDGGERIIVTYQNFQYNVPLSDSLFTVSQK